MKYKKILFWLFFLVIFYGIIEIISFSALFVLKKYKKIDYSPLKLETANSHKNILNKFLEGEMKYMSFCPDLGWTIKENGDSELYQANSLGFRASRDYTLLPADSIMRIAAFGDSFTHCDDVKNEYTWQSFLEESNENLEVLNFGVSGYGLDQAYLRYLKEGVNFKPEIVFIGFMPDDIYRHVNTFRPFYYPATSFPLTKPRYKISGNDIFLIKNPISSIDQYEEIITQPANILPELGKYDYFFSGKYYEDLLDFSSTFKFLKIIFNKIQSRFRQNIIKDSDYNEDSEAFKVTIKIFDKFYAQVEKNGSIPLIILFPQRYDVLRYRRDGSKRYESFIRYFKRKNYRYIDLIEAFGKSNNVHPVNEIFIKHYSSYGNKIVAEHIQNFLHQESLE